MAWLGNARKEQLLNIYAARPWQLPIEVASLDPSSTQQAGGAMVVDQALQTEVHHNEKLVFSSALMPYLSPLAVGSPCP
eukprot:3115370-Amphidinium_carterae.1